MGEAKEPGVQAEAVQRVIAIAILHVAADRMSHVGRVDANLVLATCLELVLHEGVVGGAVEHMEMGNGELAAIVHGR